MKPTFVSGYLMVVIGAALAFLSMYALPHCGNHGDTVMPCTWLVRATSGVGLTILVSGVVMKFVRPACAAGIQIGNALIGLFVILLSTVLIGTCNNPMMACHGTTKPALIVAGVVIALIAALDAKRLSARDKAA